MSYPEPDPALSRDALHSDYQLVAPPPGDPPAGHGVEQTLGLPQVYAPTITALDPTSAPAGPPDNVLLRVSGTDLTWDAQIAFGKDAEGNWRLERTDHPGDGTLTTWITAGLFPNPDPAVPVAVVTPRGEVSNEVTFAFTASRSRSES